MGQISPRYAPPTAARNETDDERSQEAEIAEPRSAADRGEQREPRPLTAGVGLTESASAGIRLITANFIHRTFRIRCGPSIGTAFTVDIDGRQYLVTARHVIAQFD